MKTPQLLYVGIKGSVVALNRANGEQVWATHLKGSEFVNVLVEDGAVLASCFGEVFCLEPLTGKGLWHNGLKGFGRGLATFATERSSTSGGLLPMAERRRRDEEAAAAAAAAASA